MTTRAMVPFLVGMMLLTGVCNTLLTKYQDLQCVRDCESKMPKRFNQPIIQTAQMFIGEMGCWLVVAGFWIHKRYIAKAAPLQSGYQRVEAIDGDADEDGDLLIRPRTTTPPVLKPFISKDDNRQELTGWRLTLLALPACCDIIGTTLMNVGLLLVAASIYQMTRGALVLFVGLLSVMFLRKKLYLYQWSALFIVMIGVGLVGLAGAIAPHPQAKPKPTSFSDSSLRYLRSVSEDVFAASKTPEAVQTVLGVFLIAGAQIFTATQFVLEEWILEQYALQPLKVVGWEGVFGFLFTILGMIVMHVAVGRTERGQYGIFDAREGWRDIVQYQSIAISSVLIMISIGGFNFFGLSITRSVSATARSVIDTCRTLFIWIVSLGLGWETFKWLQVPGFALLVYGTFLFNDIVRPPLRSCMKREKPRDDGLLAEDHIEHS